MINKKMWYIGETIVSKNNNLTNILLKNSFYEKVFCGKKIIIRWNKINILAHWFVVASPPHALHEHIDSYLHQVGFHYTIADCNVYVQR
jgi:hypothetical protein